MKKEVSFDVMLRGYYVCTLTCPVAEDGTISTDTLLQIIFEKRPTLRYEKKIVVYLNK